jgi:hypothetical protein
MKKLTCLLILSAPLVHAADTGESGQESKLNWYKGNTHTHTLNSDGDSSPGEVAHWYRDHEYDFLVLSDHNYRTSVTELQREFDRETIRDERKRFVLIPGEEVSESFKDVSRDRSYKIHVNGIDTEETVGKQGGESKREVLQRVVDAIRAEGGFPHLNHPNYHWSFSADDLYAMENLRHFEIFNGHPKVHDFGGSGHPSLEEMWDDLLSRGRITFGVATDDAHSFQEWGPRRSNPGRGWIVVRAAEPTPEALVKAIVEGDFYASTGVDLEDVSTEENTLRLRIRLEGISDSGDMDNVFGYLTTFVGKDGRVLKIDESLEPAYTLQEGDLYVRARVFSSAGEYAWTQPLFADGEGRHE